MNYVIAILVALAAATLAYATSDRQVAAKIRLFYIASADNDEEFTSLTYDKPVLFLITVAVGAVSCAVMLKLLHATDVFGICRMTAALLCLVAAGCFDLREKRIPNIFPLLMVVCAAICYGVSAALGNENVALQLTSGAVAAVACFVVLTLAAVLTKGGIGAGDIKLISALALTIGVNPLVETLFYAAVLSCVAAVLVVLVKKKIAGIGVPFGPFLLLGYIVTMLMEKI